MLSFHLYDEKFLVYLKVSKNHSPQTIRAYGETLALFRAFLCREQGLAEDGNPDVAAVDELVIRHFVAELQRGGLSKTSLNRHLSALRASSVVQFLSKKGVDLSRFKVVGMSNIAPQYPNEDALGNPIPGNRERNRRVIILVSPYR